MKAMKRGELPTQSGVYWYRKWNSPRSEWKTTTVIMLKNKEPMSVDVIMNGEEMTDYQWAGPIPYPEESP